MKQANSSTFRGQQQRGVPRKSPSYKRQIFTSWTNLSRASIKRRTRHYLTLQEMKARGKTVIVVHHDLNTVPQYFDWVTMVNKANCCLWTCSRHLYRRSHRTHLRQGEDCMTILQSYTTQMVLLGTALLGLASGIAGTFAELRKGKPHR